MEDFKNKGWAEVFDTKQFDNRTKGIALLFEKIMSGYEAEGEIVVGDIHLSMKVEQNSIKFTDFHELNRTFLVDKSMPEFINYMKDSIWATAISTDPLPSKEIVDLNNGDRAEFKKRFGSDALSQLREFVRPSKREATITEIVELAFSMEDDVNTLKTNDFTILETTDKKLVFQDAYNNELFTLPKKTLKEFKKVDLRLAIT